MCRPLHLANLNFGNYFGREMLASSPATTRLTSLHTHACIHIHSLMHMCTHAYTRSHGENIPRYAVWLVIICRHAHAHTHHVRRFRNTGFFGMVLALMHVSFTGGVGVCCSLICVWEAGSSLADVSMEKDFISYKCSQRATSNKNTQSETLPRSCFSCRRCQLHRHFQPLSCISLCYPIQHPRRNGIELILRILLPRMGLSRTVRPIVLKTMSADSSIVA